MRLVSYSANGGDGRPGALLEGDAGVLDLRAAWAGPGGPGGIAEDFDLVDLLAFGNPGLEAARESLAAAEAEGSEASHVVALDGVKLLAPIARPPRLRGYLTTPGHAEGASFKLPPAFFQMPVAYEGNANATIGPDVDLSWPGYTDQLDYELEIALVIGKAGRDLSVEEAADHIAGITLLNDVSARDIQGLEMSVMLGPKKSKDFCNVIGPSVATLDGLDEWSLQVEGRVNGEVWTRTTSKNRQYSFAEVVARASWGEDHQPGEILGLGTVEGGCGVEIDRWIQPGDLVEFDLTRVGTLRNRVGAKAVTPNAGVPGFEGSPPAPRKDDDTEEPQMWAVASDSTAGNG